MQICIYAVGSLFTWHIDKSISVVSQRIAEIL